MVSNKVTAVLRFNGVCLSAIQVRSWSGLRNRRHPCVNALIPFANPESISDTGFKFETNLPTRSIQKQKTRRLGGIKLTWEKSQKCKNNSTTQGSLWILLSQLIHTYELHSFNEIKLKNTLAMRDIIAMREITQLKKSFNTMVVVNSASTIETHLLARSI